MMTRPALASLLALGVLTGCSSGSSGPTSGTTGGTTSTAPTPSVSAAAPSISRSATPAPSGSGKDGVYVALGDSLAAGFQPGSGEVRDGAYPALTRDALRTRRVDLALTNVSCSGETTASLLADSTCPHPAGSQIAQAETVLRSAGARARLVTIDIGGNDILRCVAAGAVNTSCLTQGEASIRKNLPVILGRLRAASAPTTKIFVLTYYNPFLAPTLGGGGPAAGGGSFDAVSQKLMGGVNATITAIATKRGATVIDLSVPFRTKDVSPAEVAGSPMPRNVANICSYTYACQIGDIHLTPEGNEVIAGAIASRFAALP